MIQSSLCHTDSWGSGFQCELGGLLLPKPQCCPSHSLIFLPCRKLGLRIHVPPTWGKKPLLTVYVLGLHRGILLCWLFSQILQCSLFSYPCPVKFHMKKKRSRSVKSQKHRAGETAQQIKAPVLQT